MLFFRDIETKAIDLVESTLQRPATQGEAEAFALSAQKFHETYRYRNFFAWTLAAGAAYRSRSNFRFPFYTPKDQTRFDSFPSKTLPMLKGSGAKLCWHLAARFPAYLIGAYWTFSPLFNAIGGVTSLLLLRQDSRSAGGIKETTEKLTQKERERQASLQTRVGQSERDSPRRYPQQVLDPITKDDPQEEPRYSDMDENQRAFQTSEQLSQAYPSNEPERRPRDQLQIASTPSSSSPGPNRNRRPESAYSSSEPAFHDDSSPSGAQVLKPTGSYQESGSAWDRVRSTSVGSDQASPWDSDQATKPQYQKKAQQRSYWGRSGRSQDENETTGDSFSFSKSTEEKELAKEQAQREFDSMVEAERRGQDGNKGGGSGVSWNR